MSFAGAGASGDSTSGLPRVAVCPSQASKKQMSCGLTRLTARNQGLSSLRPTSSSHWIEALTVEPSKR